MAQQIGLDLSGSILCAVVDSTSQEPIGLTSVPQPTAAFQLALQSASQFGDAEASGRRVTLTTAVEVPLGLPAVGADQEFLGRFFYFRALDRGADWSIEITFATAGAIVHRTGGILMLETPVGDEITAITVQGTGAFEWMCTGAVQDA